MSAFLDRNIEGERLKHTYQLIRQISKDDQGRTYLAIDQTDDEEYAVRFIKSDLIDKTLYHQQLQKKINWLIALEGQHIVRLVDIGAVEESEEEYSFLVMAPLKGKSLRELLAKPKPLAVRQTFDMVRQVALGLEEVRQQGVQAHRDLNPAKIYIDHEGTVKIIDFSVALHVSEDAAVNLDDPVGTPAYMSPEQIDDPLDVDMRTDIYALGVITFEMLMRERPFEGKVSEIFLQHIQERPPAIHRSELSEAETAQIQAIVTRCLAKNRVERFQSPGELAQAIDAFLQGAEADDTMPEPAVQNAAPLAPSQKDRPQASPSASSELAELEARLKKMETRLQQISQPAANRPPPTAVPPSTTSGVGGLWQRLSLFSWVLLVGAILLLCMAGVTLARMGSSDDVLAPITTAQAESNSTQIALAATVVSLAERPTITPIPTQTATAVPTATVLPTETAMPPPPTATPVPTPSLPLNQVNALLFRNERLWAVFSGRLAAFDGENWQVFTVADGLPGGDLTDVLLDNQGEIWVGATTGLGYMNASGWTIFTVASERIPSNTVTAVAFDGTNRWFGTDNGLARFDGSTWDIIEPPTLLAYDVTALAVDNGLWVGTSAGLNRFDGRAWSAIAVEEGAVGNEITAVAPDGTGRLWVGTSQGLRLFDSVNWQTVSGVDELENNIIHDITVGPDDIVWLATENGLLRYDGAAWTLFTVADGLVSNKVTAVTTDSTGNVWLGTAAGLMRYDGTTFQPAAVPDP